MLGFDGFLIACQGIGALIGAGSAVLGEVAYVRALCDGRIDEAERAHLNHLARGLRFGMMLALLASLGLVILAYLRHAMLQPALTSGYWIFVALALGVIYLSWAISRRRISFVLGSAAAFTAWWFLAYLSLGFLSGISFGAAVALYVVAAAVFYALLRYAHFLIIPPGTPRSS